MAGIIKFDTRYIDLNKVALVTQNVAGDIFLKLLPIEYTDGKRNPRLPRKTSKQTNLQVDTNFILNHAFKSVGGYFSSTNKYKVVIKIFKCGDKLGNGDLDNYCKAILDAVTFTKKVWHDDRQVDEIHIKRVTGTEEVSYLELSISKI